MTDQPTTQEAEKPWYCACGAAVMPSPKNRSFGWECGICGRGYGITSLGLWQEVRGSGPR